MSARHVGRNDPCPCGSGKKYKRCCLSKVEAAAPQRAMVPLATVTNIKAQIEAAHEALAPHRAALAQVAEDERALLDRSRALFGEARFDPLRFTLADVERAFAKVGKPSQVDTADRFVERIREAILVLADKERRQDLSLRLLLHLPALMTEGRPLDACLLEECACQTVEQPDESNPFLFQMFVSGYDAWRTEQRRRDRSWLRRLGLEPGEFESRSMAEIESRLRECISDPAQQSRVEEYMRTHPDEAAEAVAEYRATEHEMHRWLDEPEACSLLLAAAEVEPWLRAFADLIASFAHRAAFEQPGVSPNAGALDAAAKAIEPLLGEMVATVFTSDRLAGLEHQLRTLRDTRQVPEDRRAIRLAQTALSLLRGPDQAGRDSLLRSLCFLSLRRRLNAGPATA